MKSGFLKDGRIPLEDVYHQIKKLIFQFGWKLEEIFKTEEGPILGLKTPQKGPSLWLVSGIHGEEPAGVNALVENISSLVSLSQKGILIVLLPLCNPVGYLRNWRYPNEPRDLKKGNSVEDSEHFLLDLTNPSQPRRQKPVSPEAKSITEWVLKTSKDYPPSLVLDFHEDEDETGEMPYIFFLGEEGFDDPVAKKVVRILKENDFSLKREGQIPTGEKIKNGIVANIVDGSLDELLSAKKIYFQGKIIPGPGAKRVVTVGTSSFGIPLKKRVKAHSAILRKAEVFWRKTF